MSGELERLHFCLFHKSTHPESRSEEVVCFVSLSEPREWWFGGSVLSFVTKGVLTLEAIKLKHASLF